MKTRLNNKLRDQLTVLATHKINASLDRTPLIEAHKLAAVAVRKAAEKQFPTREMKVLAKYKLAAQEGQLQLKLSNGATLSFHLTAYNEHAKLITVPKTAYWHGERHGIVPLDDEASKLVIAYGKADTAVQAVFTQRNADYRQLILSSATFEDVLAVWPEAIAVQPPAQSRALVVLMPDVLARIKQDVAARMQQKRKAA